MGKFQLIQKMEVELCLIRTFRKAVTLPLELTAAAFTIQFWDTEGVVNIAVWITIFTVVIFALNVYVFVRSEV